MNDLYAGIKLNEEQNQWICRGLLDLAAVDGVHANEEALIHEFYCSAGGDPSDLVDLEAQGFDPANAADVLQGNLVEAFLMSCYMLIYADGHQSEEERVRIGEFAAAMGVDRAELDGLHTRARLYLLQMLAAEIRNRDAIRTAGAALGLTQDDIAGIIN
jgi:hypothetical protein